MLRANLQEIIQDHSDFRDFVDQRARHIRRLIIENIRRLQVLELREAQKGIDTEPSILIEIQDIRTAVEELRKQIRDSEPRTDFLIKQITDES